MRMSCNGCRVLRKGCSENCSIRPCLQWIKNPEAQANATVFLAKFYGRAGLMNLINAGSEHLRPAIFRSLLYEACGRIVNPIYGSVGLLWSGSWHLCQAAVESVLKGEPIVAIQSDSTTNPCPPMKAYDIRHVCKDEAVSYETLKVKSRIRFKRSAKPKQKSVPSGSFAKPGEDPNESTTSHDSSTTHVSGHNAAPAGDSRETESMFSGETIEATIIERGKFEKEDSDVELELTLGFEPIHRNRSHTSTPIKNEKFTMNLGLELNS